MSLNFTPKYLAIPGGNPNAFKLLQGSLTLVAGAASEALDTDAAKGIPDDAAVWVTVKVAGGTEGIVAGTFVKATRTVALQSSEALDTSTCRWMILQPVLGD